MSFSSGKSKPRQVSVKASFSFCSGWRDGKVNPSVSVPRKEIQYGLRVVSEVLLGFGNFGAGGGQLHR
jgi:hypothetical protein